MARRRSSSRRGAGFRMSAAAWVGVALLGLGVALLAYRNLPLLAGAQGPADDAVSAGARLAEGPFAPIGKGVDHVVKSWTSVSTVEAQKREIAELREWKSLALALAERNARYEALLKLPADAFGEAYQPGSGLSARLTIQGGGPFRRTLLANAGKVHGVERGFVAVSEHGLVGRVVAVGERSARVLMLDDYNSRVPVVGQASRVRAMLVGQSRSAPRLDAGAIAVEPPRLDYIVGEADLREGERIVTSGDGGLFPAGLMVGVAARDRDGRWRVRLSSARAPVDYVRLVPFAPLATPEEAPVLDASEPLAAPPPPKAAIAAAPSAGPTTAQPVAADARPAPVRPPAPKAAVVRTARPAAEVDEVDAPPAAEGPPQ